ncbi:MFS transporter [Aestuariivirga litoralis]|uniref:MFS transporter n=1 Tax=Aestuariivirga litoralis TaxID=2650924 RepID=UPI0018C805A7|nr:MFS transporter [Aestuariivirga litoralis]MBG1233610.1 MFS transporter [Aestuariivirga litoralis]
MKITPRVAVTLTFIAFGAMMGAQLGAIPVLKAQSGTDSFWFGVLTSVGTAANIVAMSLGGQIAKRFDNRSVMLFIMPVIFAALVYSLMVQSVFAFGLSFILLMTSIGALDLFMNAEAAVVEHDAGKPLFGGFHGAVLLAMGLFGLISSFIAVNYGAVWSLIPPLPFTIAAIYAVNKAIPHRPVTASHESASQGEFPRKILILMGVVVGLEVAAEFTCVQWSGQLLAALQPKLAAYSGLGIAFYGLFSGGIRVVGDRLRQRFDDLKLVAVSLCVGLVGFVTLALDPGFLISVIAFAVVGIGQGLIFPCLFSQAARLAPANRASAFGLISLVSGPPRILLPLLLGILAQSFGIASIYLASAIGIATAIGFSMWIAREIDKRKEAQVSPRLAT